MLRVWLLCICAYAPHVAAVLATSKDILPRSHSLGVSSGQFSIPKSIDVSDWSLEDRIGQLLMVGYRDPSQIKDWKVGGVVLFAWNLEKTIEGTKKGIDEIRKLAEQNLRVPLFISTDQEGGRVLRIRRGMTPFPDAAAMGEVADPFKSFLVGKYMGIELKALGINMNFAPVLDFGGDRSFLKNRTWGKSEIEVANYPIHFMRGLHSSGVLAVAKHFPGHGSTEVDSHFAQPVLNKSLQELWDEDLYPFQSAVSEGAMAMMTAHVTYPKIDEEPASFSKKFLQEILRDRMGFQGIVITDDLEMDGAKSDRVGYGELAVKSLEAGSDMILLVWSKSRQEQVLKAVKEAVTSGRLSEEWLNKKVQRILSVKQASLGTLKHSELLKNEHWRANLRTPEAVRLANVVSLRAMDWWKSKPEVVKNKLRQHWDHAWSVYVPEYAWKKIWKMKRPQDEVKVYDSRKRNTKIFADLKERLSFDDEPIVLLTPPRKHWKSQFEWGVENAWVSVNNSNRKMPILWIHQGRSFPKFASSKKGNSMQNRVSLFSETFFSFRQIQTMLSLPVSSPTRAR